MRHAVAVLIALAALAPVAAGAGDSNETITVGGVERTFVLHVPESVASPAALVVSFHGHYGTGAGQARLSGLDGLSDRYGFVVAYPDGLNRGWNDGRPGGRNTADDLGFARALVARLTTAYHIDPKRVYATGMSNGGTFSQYLACSESAIFAAIASVAGSLPSADEAQCHPGRPVPVMEIAGTADPIMPYDGGDISLLGFSSGQVLSFEATLAFWAKADGCASHAATTALPPVPPPDGTSVTRYAYSHCAAGSDVVGYAIAGGGHTWPGGAQYLPKTVIGPASNQLQASETIVNFFLAHPMP